MTDEEKRLIRTAQARDYYHNCGGREYHKKYYWQNAEKKCENARKYYETHREQRLAYQKKYKAGQKEYKTMKIVLNIEEFYRLMRERNIKSIRQLSRESGITCECLYGSVDKGVTSKETYWRLAKFFGCHVEDLQTPVSK